MKDNEETKGIGILCAKCQAFIGCFFVDDNKLVNGDELMQFLYANQIIVLCSNCYQTFYNEPIEGLADLK